MEQGIKRGVSLCRAVTACVALMSGTAVLADDAYLRLRCDGDSEGADVHINGKLKGQCPIDIAVPEGQINLQVRKDIGKGQYRLYQKTLFLSAGAMKRETVVLSPEILLTPEGRKIELARQAEAKAAEEAARLQAERDAPRLAAEKAAAQLAAQEAARRAEPGMVHEYMQMMSSEHPQSRDSMAPTTALLATLYAPLMLPVSTTSDLADGKSIATTEPPRLP